MSKEEKSLSEKLYESRIIVLNGVINDESATAIMFQLLNLAKEDAKKDIHLYINSPGGSVSAGMAIYDTMKFIEPQVSTVCYGMAASMGSFLLSSGAKGKRHALPHSKIIIHQPLSGFGGSMQQTDIQIFAENIGRTRQEIEEILAENTAQPLTKIHTDCERDNYMSAQAALQYGLIDKILTKDK